MAYMSENIDRYLRDISYPAGKGELVNNAITKNAPEDIVRNFDMLPDKRFDSAEDVRRNIQKGSRMSMRPTGRGYSARAGTSGRESGGRSASSSRQER